MPEVNNFKRKRANRSSYVVNPDGNCTPSDSDSDDDVQNRLVHRKILRRQSSDSERVSADNVDDDESSVSSRADQGNNEFLFAALRKIQELENELAELDEADYDSGHQEEDEVDEGTASDYGDNAHNHQNDILNADAEALGFAFCVKETFEYLAAQGLSADNPIITTLRDRFLGQCRQFPLP